MMWQMTVDAWAMLVADHGTKDLAELLKPAIDAAEQGYPVLARVAHDWATETEKLQKDPNAAAVFMPGGVLPGEGDLHRQPALGATLRKVASGEMTAEQGGKVMPELRRVGGSCPCSKSVRWVREETLVDDGTPVQVNAG